MHVTVVIAARNRATYLPCAIDAALAQSHPDLDVVVIDDASTDATRQALAVFHQTPRVSIVRLAVRRGIPVARNLGLLLAPGDAATFHDPEDVPSRHKIAAQVEALEAGDTLADPARNWAAIGRREGEPIRTDAALIGHVLIRPDGSEELALHATGLVEDLFPNLPSGATEGQRVLIEPALFRLGVFERLGGFADSLEAARDLRNRILLSGGILGLVQRPLLTRFLRDEPGGAADPARRDRDRAAAWARLGDRAPAALVEPIDLARFCVDAAHSLRPLIIRPGIPVRGTHPSLVAFGVVQPDRSGRPIGRDVPPHARDGGARRYSLTGRAAGTRARSGA